MKQDTTSEMKKKTNKLIAANNAVNNVHKLSPIVGDFFPLSRKEIVHQI